MFLSVVSTNPATLLGVGTWTQIAAGRMLVGQTSGDPDFDVAEETGGAKTVTLTAAEMPSHTHVQDAHTHTQNSHTHPTLQVQGGTTAANNGTHPMTSTATGGSSRATGSGEGANAATAVNQNATATNQNTGGGGAHNNLPPYFVVYAWKRTA